MINRNPTKPAAAVFGLMALTLAALAQGPLPPPPPLPSAQSFAPVKAASAPLLIPEGLAPENRDPFWPVGYRPKSKDELERERAQAAQTRHVINPALWDEAQAVLRIGGSMQTPQGFTALINGELVKTGDIVSLRYKNQQYRWKIDSVALSGVSLSRLDVTPLDQLQKTSGKDRP